MAHFPGFRRFIRMMENNSSDREHFTRAYAGVLFDIIISINNNHRELLIGGQGINWACTMEISDDFEIFMDDADFYALRDLLDLRGRGITKFGSYLFLNYFSERCPNHLSNRPIQPNVIRRYIRANVEEDEKTVFYRWIDQTNAGRIARNFEKTEEYFGFNVADYCRRNNITSQWLTPEKARELHVDGVVNYPWRE